MAAVSTGRCGATATASTARPHAAASRADQGAAPSAAPRRALAPRGWARGPRRAGEAVVRGVDEDDLGGELPTSMPAARVTSGGAGRAARRRLPPRAPEPRARAPRTTRAARPSRRSSAAVDRWAAGLVQRHDLAPRHRAISAARRKFSASCGFACARGDLRLALAASPGGSVRRRRRSAVAREPSRVSSAESRPRSRGSRQHLEVLGPSVASHAARARGRPGETTLVW